MEVTVTVNDADVRAALARVPAQLDTAMRAAMTDATVYLLAQMRTYPPQRAGSAYKRTDTLKGSWSRLPLEGDGADLVGRVASNGNAAPYNRYVQDAEQQARVHRGLWTNTAQAVAQRSAPAINEMFRNRIAAALG